MNDGSGRRPKRGRGGRPKKPYSPHYRANNDGGYGNPPVKSQFGPGNPGGPGRPKGSTTIDQALRKMFSSKVPVTKDGRVRHLEMTEAVAERLRKEALTGSLKAIEVGIRLAKIYGPTGEENKVAVFDFSELSHEDRLVLKRLLDTSELIDRRDLPGLGYRPKKKK